MERLIFFICASILLGESIYCHGAEPVEAKTIKIKSCLRKSDLSDTDGNYIKSVCQTYDEFSHEQALDKCEEIGMKLFVIDSAETEAALYKFADTQWPRYFGAALWVNGHQEKKSGYWYVDNQGSKELLYENLKWHSTHRFVPTLRLPFETVDFEKCLRTSNIYGEFRVDSYDCNHRMTVFCEYDSKSTEFGFTEPNIEASQASISTTDLNSEEYYITDFPGHESDYSDYSVIDFDTEHSIEELLNEVTGNGIEGNTDNSLECDNCNVPDNLEKNEDSSEKTTKYNTDTNILSKENIYEVKIFNDGDIDDFIKEVFGDNDVSSTAQNNVDKNSMERESITTVPMFTEFEHYEMISTIMLCICVLMLCASLLTMMHLIKRSYKRDDCEKLTISDK